MSTKEKALEICNNLEQTIEKGITTIMSHKNSMFDKPTISSLKLKNMQARLMRKYKLTKKDLKWKK
tara:strand:+ start:294 stop:491 length:198 start_codon:yes stop_codon:yes gene_type:complete